MREDSPLCDCHGLPMYWNKRPHLSAGGYWHCAVKARDESRVRMRGKRATDPDFAERVRDWGRQHQRTHARYRRHGITREDALAMYEAQGGRCAGCREPFEFDALDIDHDHDHCARCAGRYSCGDSIRGLLCRGCNKRDALAA